VGSRALLRIAEQELTQRASRLRWLLLDVDGVLTDGRLYYGAQGEEIKVFHARDGLAIKLARAAGLDVGLLSGRASAALELRAGELGCTRLLAGREDKSAAFAELLREEGLTASEVAYIGDDLPDLPVLRTVSISLAPADAAPEVREQAAIVLTRGGGDGAVREAVELLLEARGVWRDLVAKYR
jgi:3-deoxy-D-manno-octulosonate 8-phosphate phosphatase (KDO 8-P phosphatase)